MKTYSAFFHQSLPSNRWDGLHFLVAQISNLLYRGFPIRCSYRHFVSQPTFWVLLVCLTWDFHETVWAKEAGQISTSELVSTLVAPTAPAGFCVHLGCGDAKLTAQLAQNQRLVIHGLEADESKVKLARTALGAQGLYGQVSVETWKDAFLPYADNVVNVLVMENPNGVEQSELLRVLAPLGCIWTRRGGAWSCIEKPWPKELDEWTHSRHGADANMVSRDQAVQLPTGLRWIAGPPQDPGGRKWYYDHVLVSAAGRNFYVYEDEIVARDAFNGRLLWRRPAKAYIFKETGVTLATYKIGNRTSKVRPVAVGHRLYAPIDGQLVALNAETGETVQTYGELKAPREIAVCEDTLLLAESNGLRGFKLSGPLLWKQTDVVRRVVAGDRSVFYLNANELVSLNLSDGKERWRTFHQKVDEAQTFAYYNGVIVLERSVWRDDGTGSGIVAFDSVGGLELWSRNYKPGMSHYKEPRTVFADRLVWTEVMTPQRGERVKWVGLEPKTGKETRTLGARGLHCSAPVATEHYLITAEMEFTDIESGKQGRSRMVKSACRLPFIPANGLLYSFPVQCECFPMLRGYMGLAQKPVERHSSSPRLQAGPAFGRTPNTSLPGTAPNDWPMYRHDALRSGASPSDLPVENLEKLWDRQLVSLGSNYITQDWSDDPYKDGVITSPVCVGDVIVIAVTDQHKVIALNANTGAELWNYIAGGRIDLPPSIYEGLCLFGAHDGYVYCVNLADGQLVWRFRAAPYEARIPVYGQMESSWPVPGSVLVDNGVAYFAGGRHPMSDGGVYVYALRPRTGEIVWQQNLTDAGVKNWYSAMLPNTKVKVGVDYEPMDILVRDGDKLAMSRWQFEAKNGKVKLAFTSTNYQAYPNLTVPRGLWSYGIRQNKMVLERPPIAFNQEKLCRATTNDFAVVLAGATTLTGTGKAEIQLGSERSLQLEAPVIHDGLIIANGRVYAATRKGRLYCFGAR